MTPARLRFVPKYRPIHIMLAIIISGVLGGAVGYGVTRWAIGREFALVPWDRVPGYVIDKGGKQYAVVEIGARQ